MDSQNPSLASHFCACSAAGVPNTAGCGGVGTPMCWQRSLLCSAQQWRDSSLSQVRLSTQVLCSISFSISVLPCPATWSDWAMAGSSYSHIFSICRSVWTCLRCLAPRLCGWDENSHKDQKTFPACFVVLVNPSTLQGMKAFSLFFLSLLLQMDRTVLKKMVKLDYKGVI